jgi:tRNA-splicing ligase RtcB
MNIKNAKLWTEGVPVEHDALEQIRNLASLPIVAGHVAVMPDVHVGKGATVGTVFPTKSAVVPAAVGVDIGCFRGDMKVVLLDGTQATFEDLERRSDPFWVYAINANGKVAPGRARCVRTRRDAPLMRVVVSGGDEVVCTPDHEFMLNDGTYKRADALQFNDSLMPLYRRWQTRDGYESASNGKGSAKLTHVLVWEALNGTVPAGHVVHHRNHIHFDNRPENLELMTVSAHSAYHREAGNSFNNDDEAFQRLRRAGISRRREDPLKREGMARIGTENIQRYMKENPEHFADSVKNNGKRGAPYLARFNTTPKACDDCGEMMKNPSALYWHKQKEHHYNHKVLLVEALDEIADVYCLQVEEHHNFALASGVFVHNCGMGAQRLAIKASDLPDSLSSLRSAIESKVPVGHGQHQDPLRLSRQGLPGLQLDLKMKLLDERFERLRILSKLKRLDASRVFRQLGSLGGGNHFIELCIDESDDVWVMLHSGSRNIGKVIGETAMEMARKRARELDRSLPDRDLAWLDEGTESFDEYIEAMRWAQDYAALNRDMMMHLVRGTIDEVFGRAVDSNGEIVNCHHNFTSLEEHYGEQRWVTRKGAVSAKLGEMGIIPGSMGARSYIVRGKGNPESYCSCSHGAGRRLSRSAASKTFSLTDLLAQTEGVECRKDEGVIDEIPQAYKDIDAVMAAQEDLVEKVHTLKQVMCIKG